MGKKLTKSFLEWMFDRVVPARLCAENADVSHPLWGDSPSGRLDVWGFYKLRWDERSQTSVRRTGRPLCVIGVVWRRQQAVVNPVCVKNDEASASGTL